MKRFSIQGKKGLTVLLALTLALVFPGCAASAADNLKSTLLVEPLSDSETTAASTPDASSVQFQSLDGFAHGELDYDGPSTSGSNIVYSLSGSASDYDIIQEYVELLTDCMNLALVDSYEATYKSGNTYFSYALNYTGTANVTGTSSMNFKDGVEGNITLYGIVEDNDLDVSMWVTNTMEAVDMGWRCGGSNETLTLAGESAASGLYLLSDGSYQTSDGRLTAALGTADILLDGEEIISDAEYTITEDKEVLEVNNFYRTESVYFTTEPHQLLTGDIYTFEDLRDDNNTKETYNWGPDGFYMGTAFAVYHNGNWRYPEYNDSAITELTVRVMYYEDDVAVFYIYTELTTSPYTIELLAAVNLSTAVEQTTETESTSSSSDRETCWSCYGDGDCQSCDGKGYKVRWRGGYQTEVTCASCAGSGKCSICGGDGYL